MFKVENTLGSRALLLAPMEDVTDIGFRKLCKEMGADILYTEFVNAEGLIRDNVKTRNKMIILDEERPIGIQIYGENIGSMVKAAIAAQEENPEMIDINAGCWVKKIANRGAGAGLLKDPPYLENMVSQVVKAVSLPVTVKTRIGWDSESINILEVARRIEDAGAKALTLHCRTRCQGHSGDPDWEWINKVKEVIKIPVFLNGGVFSAYDVQKAFNETNADGVMIARGAITHPWIFKEAKLLLEKGIEPTELTAEERILTALKHLNYSIITKGEKKAVLEFRKHYTGYLRGLYDVSRIRTKLMQILTYAEVKEILEDYLLYLKNNPKVEK